MFRPLQNYVLLEEVQFQNVTEGGIILADNADLPPSNRGKILAIGPDCKLGLKEGDEVIIQRHRFETATDEKKKFLIGREDAIIGVV